jgi:hypothetical protein
MAQIIKHRRGLIGGVKNLTARNGELIIASGSIDNLSGPFVFIGSPNTVDEGVAGAFNSVSKLYTGTAAPTITAATYGSALDGTPYYASGNKSIYILNNSNVGNTQIDLTGNIEGNTISGVTITKLQSTAVSASFFTGSFKGDGTALYNVPASGVTGLELNQIGQGSVTASITEAGGLRINTNTEVTGTLKVTDDVTFEQDLYVSGNIYQTGSFFTQGNIILSGSINIGDNLTGDTINFGGEISSSIIPAENNSFDLGSATNAWNDLYVSGTAYIENISLAGISVNSLALPGTLTVSGTTTLSGSVLLEDLTNNRVVIVGANGLLEDDANFTFDGTTLKVGDGDFEIGVSNGNIRTSGSLLVKSDATITGSLNVTGSANVVGPVDIKGDTKMTGSLNVTNIKGTGSLYLQADQTDGRYFEIYNTAASDTHIKSNQGLSFFGDDTNYLLVNDNQQTVTITGVNGVFVSSSLNVTGSSNLGGNTNVNGVLTVTGNTQLQSNLYVSGNLEVLGSSTNVNIQSQTVNIGDNIVQVNAYSPFDRYAGLSAYDSGSVGLSGSVLWDSTNDYWLIVNSNANSSKIIGTTASTGGTGTEISLTSGTFPIATASNTIGDSLLTYGGTTLAYNTNKFTVDSGNGDTAISGNLTLSYSGGTDGGTKTSRVTFRNSSNVLGYVSTTETTNELDGILGYNHSSGVLEFSTLIDGGTY